MANEKDPTENLRRAIVKKNEKQIGKYIKQLREKGKLDIPISFNLPVIFNNSTSKITLLSYYAIWANAKKINELLSGKNAANVLAPNEDGSSTLYLSLKYVLHYNTTAYHEVIDILLKHSPEKQLLQPYKSRIPLHLTLIEGDLKIIQTLLQHVPDEQLTYCDSKGMSTFDRVFSSKNKGLRQWLILNYRSIACETNMLKTACTFNDVDNVKLLLKHNPEKQISTEIIYATCLNGSVETLQYLFQTAETLGIDLRPLLNSLSSQKAPPLHAVICPEKVILSKKLAMLEILLKIDPEKQLSLQTPEEGFNALHAAIEEKSVELVEKLTACPNQTQYLSKNNKGKIPLHLALELFAKKSRDEDTSTGDKIINLLLKHGPQQQLTFLEEYMHQEDNPLAIGIKSNFLTFVEAFVKTKTSEELLAIHQAGTPLLHFATFFPDMLKVLLKADTKKMLLNASPHHYKPSLDSESTPKNYAPNIILIASGGPLNTALMQGKYESAIILIEHGADVAQKNSTGWAPLHYTCQYNHLPSFHLILDRTKNVDIPTTLLFTPLHIACQHGNLAIAKALIERGANVNCINASGATPLYYAAFYGHNETVKLLLDNKADPNTGYQREGEYTPPMQIAFSKKDTELTRLFLVAGVDIYQPVEFSGQRGNLLNTIKYFSIRNNKFFRKVMQIIATLNLPSKQEEPDEKEQANIEWENAPLFANARTFLLKQGYTEEDIAMFEEEREKNELLLQRNSSQFDYKNTPRAETVYYWDGNSFASKDDSILSIASPSGEAYCYLDTTNLEAQGCDTSKLNLQRLKFSGHHIKKLEAGKGEYSEWIKLPNAKEPQHITYTHELKINQVDRVLLFPLKADNGSTSLYVGTRYIGGGLHTHGSISSLIESTKTSSETHFLQIHNPKVNAQKTAVNTLS